jgi:hypothetical protein
MPSIQEEPQTPPIHTPPSKQAEGNFQSLWDESKYSFATYYFFMTLIVLSFSMSLKGHHHYCGVASPHFQWPPEKGLWCS